MLFSFFHSFAVIGGTLNMKKGYSSLKITFLASFEVILGHSLGHFRSFQVISGHFRSFQVILAFKTPRKRFVAFGSRKKRYLRVCWSLFTRCLRYLLRNKVFNGLFSCSTNRLRSTNFEEMLLKNRKISKLPARQF